MFGGVLGLLICEAELTDLGGSWLDKDVGSGKLSLSAKYS